MEYTEDEISQAMELYPSLWIEKHHIKNEVGIPIEFKDRKFLKAIYDDMSPLQAILKAPQIGLTTTQIIKSLYVAKKLQKQIIYTLPTSEDIKDMAGGKVNRVIAQNPVLLEWVKDHSTVEQKSVGGSIIYYRGTWTSKAAMMVSSDLNIHDETDASNRETIVQYETRLAAKNTGWRWYFSHPSIVGNGIDEYWQKSDMKEWFILCSTCKEWQFMEWPLSVDQQRMCYQCKFCGGIITDQDRREGHWRKKFPEAEFSGYHIPQLICPWIPASKIVKDFKEKEAQYFHNFVLALPYADNKSKVTLETIKGLLTDERQYKGRILFGVDTGIKIRWTYGDMNGLIEMGECDNYKELQREVDKHKDWIMVIDQGGDIIGVREFAENNQGKVFLCTFVQDKKSMTLMKWGEGEEYGRVLVDRNRLIQLTVDEMNDKRIKLYGNLEKWWNMWLHWSHMYRIVDEDKMGNLVYVWERSDRNDFALAMAYYRVAYDRFAENESTFEGGSSVDDGVPEAPYRYADGTTDGVKLTMPEITSKSDDWRFR